MTIQSLTHSANDCLYIEAAVVNSAGINYVQNKLRFIGVSAIAETSPFDNQSLIETRFGSLVVGQTLHVEVSVLDSLTGLLSGKLASRVVVIDTP